MDYDLRFHDDKLTDTQGRALGACGYAVKADIEAGIKHGTIELQEKTKKELIEEIMTKMQMETGDEVVEGLEGIFSKRITKAAVKNIIKSESYDAFFEIIEDLKRKFPRVIRTYTYYKAKKIYKYIYFPKVLLTSASRNWIEGQIQT